MSALALSRSVRDMPGLRGKPAVITTTSAPLTAARSLAPVTAPPLCHSGSACWVSSALPCGMPSTMSMSVTSASPRSAMNSAALAPTFPAPITATLFFTASPPVRGSCAWLVQVEAPRPLGPEAQAAWRPNEAECDLLGGRRSFRRHHVHALAIPAPAREPHQPRGQREQRVVLAPADVHAGVEPGAALPHQDVPRVHALAAEALDAEPLRVRLAVVAR